MAPSLAPRNRSSLLHAAGVNTARQLHRMYHLRLLVSARKPLMNRLVELRMRLPRCRFSRGVASRKRSSRRYAQPQRKASALQKLCFAHARLGSTFFFRTSQRGNLLAHLTELLSQRAVFSPRLNSGALNVQPLRLANPACLRLLPLNPFDFSKAI